MFVAFPRSNGGEGRRRRRVATWHGAYSECVEDMLEAPTLERVVTRDSFESPTDYLARPGGFAESQELDESPQPELSRWITRDFFDSQKESSASSHEGVCGGQQGHVSDMSAPSMNPPTSLAPCNDMLPPLCFVN